MTKGADIIAAIILLALAIAIIVYLEDHQKKSHLYVQECLAKKLSYQGEPLSYL